MKMSIREVNAKLKDIELAIKAVEAARDYYSDPALMDAADLLDEYRIKILDTQIDI